MARKTQKPITQDPLWYKDAIIYQLHVRAFADSNGDGIGDFRGLAGKLEYLRDLGITAIWLLPFYPSPLRDDGYDIADYTNVHPDYGTLADFRQFLREAHQLGLRVITELVVNHTSDQHAWFQRARHAPKGSALRNFYVWSDSTDRYRDARIIFKDFEASNWTWDPVAQAHYWHRFYSHQPDLNFENPEVHKALLRITDFWLEMGVDGMRLDAVPYLYECEGTNCENLPETHAFLKKLRRHVDESFAGRMLLAEANQWPEDAVAYFGAADECHMAFHFPLMPRMFMANRMEDRYPIVDILEQTPAIPESCQWALFLRNHDELTLEMVTDEERDYMYRVYASDPRARINLGIRRRLAPLLENDRRKIELMNGLLFSMPGTPIIYYGDEIGMGDNIFLGDRNGVRTPMQWSPDRNAGFSRASSQRLYLPVITEPDYHYESVNVEARQQNSQSLLWWMKRLIAMRRRHQALSRGSIEFLHPENARVLAFIRRYENETMLVVANLSRHAQYAELNLSAYKGMVPAELAGPTEFPAIGDLPYLLTIGGHSFYWFVLEPQRVTEVVGEPRPAESLPLVAVTTGWKDVFDAKHSGAFERILPDFLRTRRWFGGKARRIKSVALQDRVELGDGAAGSTLAFLSVEFAEGDPERYVLALRFAAGDEAARVQNEQPEAMLARLRTPAAEGILYAPLREPDFAHAMLDLVARRRKLRGLTGEVAGLPARAYRPLRGEDVETLPVSVISAEQSNSSLIYGDRLILKLFRKLEPGINPDYELNSFLAERAQFRNVPPVAGKLEYRAGKAEPVTLGVLQGYVRNEGDAWKQTLDALSRYFEQIAVLSPEQKQQRAPRLPLLPTEDPLPACPADQIGPYLESARMLGQRTAEMHVALASGRDDPAFVPEPFTPFYQRSLYQSMRNLLRHTFVLLRKQLPHLPDQVRHAAQQALDRESEILRQFRTMLDKKITALRTRVHGDYHLGQVLHAGGDFVIIDFEGEPARSITERRIKRSPLRDVAGMLRSFSYAAYAALFGLAGSVGARAQDFQEMESWGNLWSQCVCSAFLRAYLSTAGGAPEGARFLPYKKEELEGLLRVFLLEKAVYEIRYELNHRPAWLRIPLTGIRQLLDEAGAAETK